MCFMDICYKLLTFKEQRIQLITKTYIKMKTIIRFNAVLFLLAGFIVFSGFSSFAQEAEKKDKPTKAEKVAKKRKKVNKFKSAGLSALYKEQPQASGEIASSSGYAVFGGVDAVRRTELLCHL